MLFRCLIVDGRRVVGGRGATGDGFRGVWVHRCTVSISSSEEEGGEHFVGAGLCERERKGNAFACIERHRAFALAPVWCDPRAD
jgi:hypothetical protein